MQRFILAVAVGLLAAQPLQAQQATRFELGTHVGASILIPESGSSEVIIGIPGAGTAAGLFPPLYLTISTQHMMIEPQIAFVYESSGGNGLFNGALQLGYLMNETSAGSPYFAVHGLAVNAFGDGNSTEWAAGTSIGYRQVIKNALGVRVEARYRRYFESHLNDIGILIGVGAVFD
jgi:hypothetical protein